VGLPEKRSILLRSGVDIPMWCSTICSILQIAKGEMTSTFEQLSKRLAALGNPIRLRLLALLLTVNEPLCVCELSDGLGIPDYQTSRHLKALGSSGWVSSSRDGLWIYYSLSGNSLPVDLRRELTPLRSDLERMRERLHQRKDGRCVVGPAREGDQ